MTEIDDNDNARKTEQEMYDEVYAYPSKGEYPHNYTKQAKNSLRKRAKNFQAKILVARYIRACIMLHCFWQVIDGVLHYTASKEEPRQVVVELSMNKRILESCHNDMLGGCHFGRNKTAAKVTSRFYWKGMNKDIDEWVRFVSAQKGSSISQHPRCIQYP